MQTTTNVSNVEARVHLLQQLHCQLWIVATATHHNNRARVFWPFGGGFRLLDLFHSCGWVFSYGVHWYIWSTSRQQIPLAYASQHCKWIWWLANCTYGRGEVYVPYPNVNFDVNYFKTTANFKHNCNVHGVFLCFHSIMILSAPPLFFQTTARYILPEKRQGSLNSSLTHHAGVVPVLESSTLYGATRTSSCSRVKIKVPSVENPGLTNVLSLKPGAGQNTTTHASPTARNFVLVLIFNISKLSKFFPHFLSVIASAVSCEGPQNKIGHPAHSKVI